MSSTILPIQTFTAFLVPLWLFVEYKHHPKCSVSVKLWLRDIYFPFSTQYISI